MEASNFQNVSHEAYGAEDVKDDDDILTDDARYWNGPVTQTLRQNDGGASSRGVRSMHELTAATHHLRRIVSTSFLHVKEDV